VPREWDADGYDRLAALMTRWGETVVGSLDLVGDERVLDAGCGTGRVTEMLASRLPRGHVIALDGSPAMIERARERLAGFGERVSYVVADLAQQLPVEEPVDAVLSTATFHWIRDHQALFANLAAVMRPDAQLAAQCGGAGNIANIEAALRELGENFGGRKHFAGVRGTRADLKAAGFTDIEVWLHEEPTELAPEDLEPYLATICLGDHVEGMTDTERKAFVHEVAQRMPTSQIDYVRLNIRARRSVEET
jgi:trans-aconitate 2-methyltransferase